MVKTSTYMNRESHCTPLCAGKMQQRVVSSAPHHFWELAQGGGRLYTRHPEAA